MDQTHDKTNPGHWATGMILTRQLQFLFVTGNQSRVCLPLVLYLYQRPDRLLIN